MHTEPVPELGGLAIYCGLAAALLVASRMFPLERRLRRHPGGQSGCCWPAVSWC